MAKIVINLQKPEDVKEVGWYLVVSLARNHYWSLVELTDVGWRIWDQARDISWFDLSDRIIGPVNKEEFIGVENDSDKKVDTSLDD